MSSGLKIFWFFAILFSLLFFISAITNILLPFVIGIIFAYFLDPAADKLERKGCSRSTATAIILILFIFALGVLAYFIGPILYAQTKAFAINIPLYIQNIETILTPYIHILYSKIGDANELNNIDFLGNVMQHFLLFTQKLFSNILQSSLAFINLLSLLIITPIVTFYLLRDWDILMENITKLVPKKIKKDVLANFRAIDKVLSAYIRGQTNVCLFLGIFYAFWLSIFDLNQGFLIGFLTGVFSFIPYFGMIIGLTTGVVVAFFQYENMVQILIILSVFIVGQFLEGNFITPKLVGNKIGIHPVLIIFALLAGASLFGFLGILFAIPTIAVIGVLFRFALKNYKRSKFFLAK